MGSKVNISRIVLNVSDIDRNYYKEHKFTIAHQPSDAETYIIVRILVFALNAKDRLLFTNGNDRNHEPDIWLKDLTGDIELWIEIGEPHEKRVRKACARSKEVIIYTYTGENSNIWWRRKNSKFNQFKNLSVINLPTQILDDLATMIDRTMELQCTIHDGHVWISNKDCTVEFDPIMWKEKEFS